MTEKSRSAHDIFEFKGRYYRRQLTSFGSGRVESPDSSQIVDHFRKIMSQPRKACGFKFKFDIQVACFPEVVDELHWIRRNLKVILMTRENFLKQAVSRQNMERIQIEQNSANLGRNREQLPPLSLDVDRAVSYATRALVQNEKFVASASRFPNLKTVVYEQLLADPEKIIKDVLEFIDVDPEQKLSAKLLKATPNKLSDAVENYAELAAAVKGTDLEVFLS